MRIGALQLPYDSATRSPAHDLKAYFKTEILSERPALHVKLFD